MISTLHGRLPLAVFPNPDADLTPRGRMPVCKVEGQAFGHFLKIDVSLDTTTGELLLMSPDSLVGAFRLGDLVASLAAQLVARAQVEDRLDA